MAESMQDFLDNPKKVKNSLDRIKQITAIKKNSGAKRSKKEIENSIVKHNIEADNYFQRPLK